MRNVIFLAVLTVVITACSTPGKYKYEKTTPDGKNVTVTVEGPSSSVKPARFEGDPTGKHKAATGAQQAHDFVMESMGSTLMWVGIAIVVIGFGVTAGSGYIPFLSWHHGAYAMVLGGAFIAMPTMLDRYTWLLVIVLLVASVAAVVIFFGDEIYRYWKSGDDT